MAIKVQGTTVIDDSRNIENIGTANVTSLSIGGTEVIDSNLNIVNANTYNGYTPADEAINIVAGVGLTGGGDLTSNNTISANIATIAEAQAGTSNTVLMTPATTTELIKVSGGGGEAFTAF